MYKYLIIIVSLLLASLQLSGQGKRDSLELALDKAPKEEKVVILIQLAKSWGLDSLEMTKKYSEQALELAKELNQKENLAEAYNLVGSVYYYQGKLEKALENWQERLKIYQELGQKEQIALARNSIGVVYKNMNKYDKAIAQYQKAAKIQDEIGNKKGRAQAFANIGNIYFFFGENYDKALEYYDRSLKLSEEIQDSATIANLLNSIGNIYNQRKEYQKARDYFQRSLSINKKIGKKSGIATAQNNLGRNLAFLEKYPEALEYCKKAVESWKAIGNDRGIALALMDVGFVYSRWGIFDKALQYYFRSLRLAKELNMRSEIVDYYKEISNIYEKMGNTSKALDYYKLHSELKDSIFNEKTQKQIAELETKFKTQEKEKEIAQKKSELLKKEAELLRSKILRNSLFAGLILLVLLAFWLFNRFMIKKKANDLLEARNEEILKQKEEIETQRDEIERQRDVVMAQKKEITDSIMYARRIQSAVLPPEEQIEALLDDYFILFRPRDIVSGDFYWLTEKEGKTIVVAADCTGHGVPGAFMSMLGITFLNEILTQVKSLKANEILNELREHVKTSLRQTGKQGEAKDGMDLALCIIDKENQTMQYAGAYNPLYLVRNNEITRYKADRMPIGIYLREKETFTNNEIKIQKGDRFYIFSDGYVDQFGGENDDKFSSKRFKKMLLDVHQKPMPEQREILNNTIEKWMENTKQIDDMIVIGVKI